MSGPAPVDAAEAPSLERSLFDQLVRRYRLPIQQFLSRRLANHEDAPDAAQETFLRLWRYRGRVIGDSEASGALLFRIAANIAVDRSRRNGVRCVDHHSSLETMQPVCPAPTPERWLSAQQEWTLLRDVIAGLPPKCRQVFLLSRMEGMSYAEIAAHCGISQKMVEKQISKALSLCRARLASAAADRYADS